MSGSNYLVTYYGDCATLSARIKGKFIPLISSEDKLRIENVYHNILIGAYKNVRELCEDNREAADEIAAHLVELEQTQDRLKNYIALLDERQRDAIKYLYVEKFHIKEVARQLGIALRSVHKVKDAAIDKLTEMYEYTGKLS